MLGLELKLHVTLGLGLRFGNELALNITLSIGLKFRAVFDFGLILELWSLAETDRNSKYRTETLRNPWSWTDS